MWLIGIIGMTIDQITRNQIVWHYVQIVMPLKHVGINDWLQKILEWTLTIDRQADSTAHSFFTNIFTSTKTG